MSWLNFIFHQHKFQNQEKLGFQTKIRISKLRFLNIYALSDFFDHLFKFLDK